MARITLLIALVLLFAACDDANKTAAPGKDSASASATAAGSGAVAAVDTAKTAKSGAAKDHDCGGDCADCAKKKGHDCGKDCADCAKKGDKAHDCDGDCEKGCDKCDKHADGADCKCGAGKKGETVWCDNCKAGFVDGKKITDRAEFDKAKAAKK